MDITGLFVVCVLAIVILYRILSLLAPGFVFMDLFLVFYGKSQTVHENGIRQTGLPSVGLIWKPRCSGQAGGFKMSFVVTYGWTNVVRPSFIDF